MRWSAAGILLLCAVLGASGRAGAEKDLDAIVAVVNDEVITQGDLNAMLMPFYLQYKDVYTPEEMEQRIRESSSRLLAELIENKLLLAEARKQKKEVSETEVERRLQEVIKSFPSREAFEDSLRAENVSVKELKDMYREQLLVAQIVRSEIQSRIYVSPVEVANYYNAHADQFTDPERIHLANILIKHDQADDAAARRTAESLLEKLRSGADFGELAKQFSQGPNAGQGGDLGFVERGEMLPAIDEAVFTLPDGAVSGVIETEIGYHIFRTYGRVPPRNKTLDEAANMIREIVYKIKFQEKFREYVDRLKKDAYISVK